MQDRNNRNNRRNGGNNNKQSQKAAAARAAEQVDICLYNALRSVFMDEAFCAPAITKALKGLNNTRQHPFVTSAFYGVLDNNVRLDKIINSLCERAPDKNTSVVLKIGLFYCLYADMPDYAAVNRAVELAKHVGAFSGFVNAVLKKSIGFTPKFASAAEKFSYDCSTPEWLCKQIIADYGADKAAEILRAELPQSTHIRPVKGRISAEDFASAANGGEFTEYGCYCDRAMLDRFAPGSVAVQSVSSVRAVNAYVKGYPRGKVIDLCAAPGGKSVYLSELGDYSITACDIYEHKLDLMRGYAKKLGAKIDVKLNDATVHNPEFDGAFDIVIAYCPCSGTGTIKTKPDILLKRKPTDIPELNEIQSKILDAAAGYCKTGGVLCYSTCSILKSENEEIGDKFLSAHPEYTRLDRMKLLPDTDRCDGFYIERFVRG